MSKTIQYARNPLAYVQGWLDRGLIVAGNYANKYCAVSCTGVGEDIISGAIASKIVTRVTDEQDLEIAFKKTFWELEEIDGFAGAIGLDSKGNMFCQESHPKVVYASYDGDDLSTFE